jgi:hypothetical protein
LAVEEKGYLHARFGLGEYTELKFFPTGIRAGQLIGLVETISEFGGKSVELYKVAEEMNVTIETLLPLLRAAQMLHLVAVSKGDVSLTKIGQEMVDARDKRAIYGGQLAKIEPFYTAVRMAEAGPFTAEDLAAELASKAAGWVDSNYIDPLILRDMLVHWAIYARLLEYDGQEGKFTKSKFLNESPKGSQLA